MSAPENTVTQGSKNIVISRLILLFYSATILRTIYNIEKEEKS